MAAEEHLPETQRLSVTEQWIREKLKLQHNCLAEVKSLYLPGSYKRKIRHLGNSLKNFVRLKVLDLSNNELVSVEGDVIDHVSCRSSQARMSSVNRLTRKPSVLDASDVEVLNMVAKSNWDLSKPPGLTGSSNKKLESKLYPLQGEHQSLSAPPPMQDMSKSILTHPEDIRDKHLPKSTVQPPKAVVLNKSNGSARVSEGLRVTFVDAKKIRHHAGPDKTKLSRFPAKGNFTPNPGPQSPPASHVPTVTRHPPSLGINSYGTLDAPPYTPPQKLSPHCSTGILVTSPTERDVPSKEDSTKQKANSGSKESYRRPLELLLGLVDRHWDGKRSLQHNHKFLSQAIEILSEVKLDGSNGEVEANGLRADTEVQNSERNRHQKEHREIQRLSEQLKHAHSSVADLDRQLRSALEENVSLKKQLIRVEQRLLARGKNGMQDLDLTERQASGEELRVELERMQKEVDRLRVRVKEARKVQELADMLQESHRSLVSTNERLLAELEECRARHRVEMEDKQAQHKAEVEKLHFSFNELSRTLSLMSDCNKGRPDGS